MVVIDRTEFGDIQGLALPAPEIVAAIAEGRRPAEMTPGVLLRPFAVECVRQSAEPCGKYEDSHPALNANPNKMPTLVPPTQCRIR